MFYPKVFNKKVLKISFTYAFFEDKISKMTDHHRHAVIQVW